MSEPRVVVRRAMMQDLALFKRLWLAYLEEQHDKGDLTLPNEHNLAIYCEMFRAYVSGDVLGLVLFLNVDGKDIGIHMEGEILGGFELSIGRHTLLQGVYLEPEYRGRSLTHHLYAKAMEWTHAKGLTGGVTSMLTGDDRVPAVLEKVVDGKFGSSDTKPFMVLVYWQFEKPS